MRKNYTRLLIGLLFVLGTVGANAQVTVTNPGNTTPGLAATYADLAAAVTALNAQTAISGPVTITLDPANPQTAPNGGYTINATLTGASAVNTVTFEGSANTITASAALTAGVLHDAIFEIIGSDFMTIQNFVMQENAANTTTAAATNNMTEWGIALLYATTTNGAQNITLQNNTITLNRTYQNSFGIYANATHTSTVVTTSASATTTAGGNNNLKIYSNNISNVNNGIVVVGPTAVADMNTGVDIGGTSAPTANTITNFGTTGTFSGYANVSGTVNGILVRNSLGFNVSYNSLTSSSGATGVTAGTLNGIQIPAASTTAGTTTVTSNINNNTIALTSHVIAGIINGINLPSGYGTANTTTNINANNFTTLNHTIAAATAAINAITQSGTATNGPITTSINNNTFTNLTSSSTGSFTFISNSFTRPAGGVTNANNNSIVTAFNKTGAGGTVTFYTSNGASPVTALETNNSNNFSNITVTGATTIAGWASTDGATTTPWGPGKTVTNNTFTNITGGTSAITILTVSFSNNGSSTNNVSGNIISNVTSAGTITGLTTTGGKQNFFSNTINTLSTSGAAAVTGISSTSGTACLQEIFKNKVYTLSGSNAGSTINGFLISGTSTGQTINFYNNLVGDLRATIASGTDVIRGISLTATGATSTYNVYYNSVYLNATSSGTDFGTSGIFHTANATATTAALNLRNNIIVNNSTANGTGFTVAYRRSSTTLTNYVSTSNNNLFYAGATASPNFIYYDGTGIQLPAYKTLVNPRDAGSVSENPPFLSLVGSNANFLHIDPTIATQVESGAVSIGGITDDYDSDARSVSTPDIGADEFSGVAADLTPPNISYTALANTCSLTGVSLTATITDASGVPTAGIGLPVLYWRINAGAYTAATGTFISGNNYQFNFGAGVVIGDVVSYYVVAQDNATTPNVGAFPSAGAGGFTIDPPAAATPPTTPSSYTIQPNLSGTYTVGVGGNYTTITAAVNAYNNACLTGAVLFSLIDATYPTETYPITVNANSYASAINTLTIKPAAGINPTISSAVASNFLFRILSNYVIFDGSNTVGGTTRDMTISNTGATAPGAILYASAGTTPNVGGTIKNTIFINGLNTTSNIVVGGTTSTPSTATDGYCNNFTFQNNSSRFTNHGIYITLVPAAGNGSGTLITGNDFAQSGVNAIKQSAITLIAVDGATVTNNTIGNLDQATAEVDKGIWLQSGTINTTVSGNAITNMGFSGTGTTGNAYGIWIQSANAASNILVSGNTITQLTSAGTVGTTIGTTGIYISSATAGVTIEKNIIGNIKSTNTAGYAASGMQLSSTSATANIIVRNNMIYDVAAYGNATAGPRNGYGILITAGAGYSLYYNSIHLNSNQTLAGGLPAAINITSGVTAAGAIDMRNNIFANSQTVGTERYAIYSGTFNTVFSTIDYNDYYSAGPNLGFIGSNRATLVDIQTGFGGNTNSENVQPIFVSLTDLHLSVGGNVGLDGQATPIGGITTDIDGDTRNITNPDIGADEFTPVSCSGAVGGTASGTTTFCGSGTPAITSTGYSVGIGSTYQWQSSIDLAFTTPVDITGQTNPATLTTGVVTATTYYRLKVTCTVGTAIDYSNIITVTINPNPTSSAGANSPLCVGQTLNLTGTTDIGTGYSWTGPNGFTSTSQNPSITNVTAAATGIYTFTATVTATGCFTSGNVSVTVNPTPATPVVNAITICNGSTGTLTVTNPVNDPTVTGTKIGTGTSVSSIPGPYRRFYGGHRYQMLYTAADISASGITAGQLISLSFYVNSVPGGTTSLGNVEIKLKNTGSTTLGTTFETGTTSVFTAASYQPVVGINTHTFNGSVFNWDGTSNLLVDFCFNNNDAGFSSTSTEYTVVTGSCTSFPLDNSPTVCTNATGTTETFRPNIRLEKAGAGVATYTWNPGALTGVSVNVSPTTTTVYSVTGAFPTGCTSAATNVTVTVDQPATANAGGNQTVCTGNTVTLNGSIGGTATSGTWSGGAGTFTPNNATMNAVYTPTAGEITAGTVTLTLTTDDPSGSCAAATSNMTITISPSSGSLAPTGSCKNMNVGTGATYTDATCNTIAKVEPNGASQVAGMINACVTIDATVQFFNGEPYLQRHFDILPATNPLTVTGRVTLYALQSEFDAYNTVSGGFPDLPTAPGDAAGIANLRVTEYHGAGTAPGNYPGPAFLIDPADVDIVWNAANSWWEISFDVTGFGGFYIHTTLTNGPLPIYINYFTGVKQGSDHLLNWKVTCNSTARATMILERSADSRNFSPINTITADAARCNSPFSYTDVQPLAGMNYYRLKMIDDNGVISYSGIVALLNAVKGFDIISIAPNPVTNGNFKLNVTSATASIMQVIITDMQGRTMSRQSIPVIAGFSNIPMNAGKLAAGTYSIQAIIGGEPTKLVRFVKQ